MTTTPREKPDAPAPAPLRATIAGRAFEAHPDAVLWYLANQPIREDGPPFTVQKAARCAAAERVAYDRANGIWWETVPAEGFPGWIRTRVYELDRYLGQTAMYHADDKTGQRLALAWLVLDELEAGSMEV